MPAGPAPAERRVPGGADRLVLGPGGLPEHEVARVLLAVLVGADPLARAGAQLAPVELGQPPVRREPGDGEVDGAILPHVRDAAIQQPLDQLDHRPDVLRGPGLLGRRLDPEPVAILLECAGEGIDVLG